MKISDCGNIEVSLSAGGITFSLHAEVSDPASLHQFANSICACKDESSEHLFQVLASAAMPALVQARQSMLVSLELALAGLAELEKEQLK
jgi:hypothetical protein